MVKKTSGSLRRRLSVLLVLVTLNTLFVQGAKQNPQAEAPQPAIAFINVNVVPFDRERVLAGQTVIVRDRRIAEIGLAEKTKVRALA